MSPTLSLVVAGSLLAAAGVPFVLPGRWAGTALAAFPRSPRASALCFGACSIWFLRRVWNLPLAEFGEYHVPLSCGFAVLSVLCFKWAPEFLAVRGLCGLVLLGAAPVLDAVYMRYDAPLVYVQKPLVYLCITLAILLAVQPWRLRDFIAWIFKRKSRSLGFGCLLVGCGMVLCALAPAIGSTSG
jgi:hypothetical protein